MSLNPRRRNFGVQVVQIGRVRDAQLTFGAFVRLPDHLRACGSKNGAIIPTD